ncbi:hypothetical protein P0Y35_17280 [Kiritimatiellaeota bacterium B1221]|nr:hypothetical protein [Kiritimatiellaeota bacterium B1221]
MKSLQILCPLRLLLCLGFAMTGLQASQVIANWDVVPFQEVKKAMSIGVVAFHETGVKVDFFVNGEKVAESKIPTPNPRTRVVEYQFTLDPAGYADGPLLLMAVAHPQAEGHEARVLDEITLYANAGGGISIEHVLWVDGENGSDDTGDGSEASPYASLQKAVSEVDDGGTVYLKAGKEYKLRSLKKNKEKRWTTISAAPGLSADDVHILTYGRDKNSTGRYGRSFVRWKNVSMYCDRSKAGYGNIFYFEKGMMTWLDGSVIYDANGRFAGTQPFNGKGAKVYLTDSLQRDLANAGGGFQRNVKIKDICSDIFRAHSNLVAINVSIDTIDRGETAAHPDFFQLHSPNKVEENLILYNVQAVNMGAQGIFGGGGEVKDAAFVNILLEKRPKDSHLKSQLTGTWTHVLLWNMTIDSQTFMFRQVAGLTEIDVRNCIFQNVTSEDAGHAGITVQNSHFSSGKLKLGEKATRGDPGFVSRDQSDYRLTQASPAYQSGQPLPGVPADMDGYSYHPVHPNRGAFADKNPGRGR